mmetsp:Transcript_61439/g.146525  ORF Transcript_61439/g.146525 Transcript_61439/m.146525 type:complete len:448 (+) Transcript_61439:1547-2890(+)
MSELEAGAPFSAHLPSGRLAEEVIHTFARQSEVFKNETRQPFETVCCIIQLFLGQAILVRRIKVFPFSGVSAGGCCHQRSMYRILHVGPDCFQYGRWSLLLNGPEEETLQGLPRLLEAEAAPVDAGLAFLFWRQSIAIDLELVHLLQVVLQKPRHQNACILTHAAHQRDGRLGIPGAESDEFLEDEPDGCFGSSLGTTSLLNQPLAQAVVVTLTAPLHCQGKLLPYTDILSRPTGTHSDGIAQHRPQHHVLEAIVDGVNFHHLAPDNGLEVRHILRAQGVLWHELLHGEVQCLSELGVFILFRATLLINLVICLCHARLLEDPADDIRNAASSSANYERAAGVDGLHQRNQRDLATVHQNHDTWNSSSQTAGVHAPRHELFELRAELDLGTEGFASDLAVITNDEVGVVVLESRQWNVSIGFWWRPLCGLCGSSIHLCHSGEVRIVS